MTDDTRFVNPAHIPADLVLVAAGFAAIAHGGQKYGNVPYIAHPLEVAAEVAVRGGTEAQVVAAILHDTLEDTSLSADQIADTFGDEVAELVRALTQPKGSSYADYIDALPDDAVLVKYCDSLSNYSHLGEAGMPCDRRERLRKKYERNLTVLHDRMKGGA